MEARINPFQETMLYWNDLTPYNAVHVARLQGHPDLQRLRSAIEAILHARHLTDLTIDRGRKRFYFGDTELQTDICILPFQGDARQALIQQTEIALNTPFDCRQATRHDVPHLERGQRDPTPHAQRRRPAGYA